MSDQNFNNIIAAIGPEAHQKLIDVTGQVSVLAGQELGIVLTAEEITAIEAVKLVVMTDDVTLNIEAALAQLRKVPSVAAKLNEKKTAEAVQKGHTEAIKGLSPTEKMTYARRHGLDKPIAEQSNPPAVDHQRVLADLSPNQRMSYA